MFDKKIKNEKLFVTFLATYDIESSEYSSQLCKSNVHIAICHKNDNSETTDVLDNTTYLYLCRHDPDLHSGQTMVIKENGYSTEELKEIVKDEVTDYIKRLSQYETLANADNELICYETNTNIKNKTLCLIRTKED